MQSQKEINFKLILKFIGILLMLLSAFMATSIFWNLYYSEKNTWAFVISSFITFSVGFFLYLITKKHDHRNIGKKEGYIIVTLTWLSISFFGALPFYFSGEISSYSDSFFETISGFTTTGATIISDIEAMPKSLLFWRSLTHWLGGMGIIVLTLAILPILGVGGMQLFVAEAPGTTPSRLHPRITQTAKRLWFIYVIFTFCQCILLMMGGMDFFDGINHAFSTMATGGFSTKNDSIAGFSPYIQYVIVLFMIIAGINFTLHYYLLKGKFSKVTDNDEFRFYISVIGVFVLFFTVSILILQNTGFEKAFRDSLFQVVSIVTTTGFVTYDYLLWPGFMWFILFLLMFTGGCIGSTGGGMKMIRHLILFRNTNQELKKLIHPSAVLPVRFNGKSIPNDVIHNFLAFFVLYIVIFMIGSALMSMLGLDFKSALGSVAATLGNVGPGIGSVGPVENYAHIPSAGKWLLSFLMLVGRLELFTVLLLLTPTFWKK
jgi:trk system potassium uptake protein